ncbi:MAG: NFACT family protein [Lachnospiraceae bacterium]|nr:NFACT family protein [Lachnospiraceae bacterium]
MALDGIVIANVVFDLNKLLSGGRINKIAQPEKDELLLTVKADKQYRLLISSGASLPLIYLTETNKPGPLTAPNFCMLLRKHLNSARILEITQPDMERIVQIKIEHLNELGDVCTKYLIVELMGKHSNIIFCDDQYKIIDSIKHVSGMVSSVREVLPGRDYFIPQTQNKKSPLTTNLTEFTQLMQSKNHTIAKAIYTSYTGISPLIANEICHRSGIFPDTYTEELSRDLLTHLYNNFSFLIEDVKNGAFTPTIVYDGQTPVEFSSVPLTAYESNGKTATTYDSVSDVLKNYYRRKEQLTRMRQKSSDLRHIVSTALERVSKKYDLQSRQLKDTDKRDKYKVYGDLLTTYGYQAEPGSKSLTCDNYYTGEEITIPLDETLSPLENAKKYFDRYAKLKRTFEALSVQLKETANEKEHLESIQESLQIATDEDDLLQIKQELTEYGYIRKHYTSKKGPKRKSTSHPLHYISSDGYHIYVGKNNYQNEELTFKFANGGDWWFHAKKIPGSHVIVKNDGNGELPDRVFEEAAMLAGYYSKGRDMDKVEIDYIQKKHIKKPAAAKPGFVIYHTNYSMAITPDISHLTLVDGKESQ